MRKFLPLAVMTGIMLNPFTAAYIKNDLYASFNMNEYELASENDDASNNSTHTYGYVANEWDNNAPVYESDFSLYNEIPYRFPETCLFLKIHIRLRGTRILMVHVGRLHRWDLLNLI